MDIANIGAALGGASQGVGRGMDLYARYQEIADQNRKRETEQKVAGKVQELAQSGVFQNDPQQGMRLLGDFYGTLGDPENMQKYMGAADKLQKERGTKEGLAAYAVSQVSPEQAVNHLNEFAKTMRLGSNFGFTRNPDNSFSVSGFGGAAPKTYASAEEFHNDTLQFLAPMILEPKDALEFGGESRAREAGIHQREAEAGQSEQAAERSRQLLPGDINLQGVQADQGQAAAASSRASAAESGVRARLAQAEAPLRQEALKASIGSTVAGTEAQRAETAAAKRQQPLKDLQAMIGMQAAVAEAQDAPKDRAARRQLMEAQAGSYDAKAEKRATEDKAAAGLYVDDAALDPAAVPFARKPEVFTPIMSMIRSGTGQDAFKSAATANQALTAMSQGPDKIGIDVKNGVIALPGGQRVNVGADAAYALASQYSRLYPEAVKRKAPAAAAAGVGR
jgi:hypothetical protein